jgi:putative transposase
VLNTVRIDIVRSAKDWPWRSYRATSGLISTPAWLQTDLILSTFGLRKGCALERYRAFVSVGKNQTSTWQQLRNQIYLGIEQFVDKLQTDLKEGKDLSEIPLAQRRKPVESLEYYAQKHHVRDDAIETAYRSVGYTLKAIGSCFGMHYTRVIRIVAAVEKAKDKT